MKRLRGAWTSKSQMKLLQWTEGLPRQPPHSCTSVPQNPAQERIAIRLLETPCYISMTLSVHVHYPNAWRLPVPAAAHLCCPSFDFGFLSKSYRVAKVAESLAAFLLFVDVVDEAVISIGEGIEDFERAIFVTSPMTRD